MALVRGEDYSVRWLDGDRVIATGPSNAWRTRRVTDADREAETRRFLAGSAISGRGPDGGLGHLPASALSKEAVARTIGFSSFAETMPFFRPGEVSIDANGRLWVGRMAGPDEARRYDIFDREGRMVAAVRLATDRRVIGFGARHVYVVRTNESDGLETLERLPMPALGG